MANIEIKDLAIGKLTDSAGIISVEADGHAKRLEKSEFLQRKTTVLFSSSGGAISGNIGLNWQDYEYLEFETSATLATFILKVSRVTPGTDFAFLHSKSGHYINSTNLSIEVNGDFSQSYPYGFNYILGAQTYNNFNIYTITGVNYD